MLFTLNVLLCLAAVAALASLLLMQLPPQNYADSGKAVREFLQCRLCETVNPTGRITDCTCDYDSVNPSVEHFYRPLLLEITETSFFRYFRVDLERECPFWQTQGTCMMESCSVSCCKDEEVPRGWKEAEAQAQVQAHAHAHTQVQAQGQMQAEVPAAHTEQLLSSANEADVEVSSSSSSRSSSSSSSSSASEAATYAQPSLSPGSSKSRGEQHLNSISPSLLESRMRAQEWRQGALVQADSPDSSPRMTETHFASVSMEDRGPDVDYDSYNNVNLNLDLVGRPSLHHLEQEREKERSGRWTDMVEDDCPTRMRTGNNPATYVPTSHVTHSTLTQRSTPNIYCIALK